MDLGLPITEVMGLPLHPLLVHGAVVLVPLAAIGFLVMASDVKRSNRYSPAVVFVSALAALTSFLAAASGNDFADELGLGSRDHFVYGEYLPWLSAGLFAATVLLAGLDKKAKGKRSVLGSIVALIGMLGALASLALVVYVGHTGAELVWGGR